MLKDGTSYPSKTLTVSSPCGEMFATVVFDLEKTRPIHILLHMGKAGGCAKAMTSLIADKLSHIYAHEGDDERRETIVQMTGYGCHAGDESCLDSLAQTLLKLEHQIADGVVWRSNFEEGGDDYE